MIQLLCLFFVFLFTSCSTLPEPRYQQQDIVFSIPDQCFVLILEVDNEKNVTIYLVDDGKSIRWVAEDDLARHP